jgi:hypothetical protein
MLKKISISCLATIFSAASLPSLCVAAIVPEPATVTLVGPHAEQQLIVGETVDGLNVDLTRKAEFVSENTAVWSVRFRTAKQPFWFDAGPTKLA